MRFLSLFLVALFWENALFGGITFESATECVVFLQHRSIETTVINGQAFEVWLKVPGTNVFLPKPSGFTGTGFLVSTENQGLRTNGHIYLVTAKHVALGLTLGDDDLIVTKSDTNLPAAVPLNRLILTNGWLHHEKADVSILPLNIALLNQAFASTWRQPHFIPRSFLTEGADCPDREVPLTMIGFPLGLGVDTSVNRFLPVSRQTRAASGLLDDLFFLLQDPAIEGYSGSPLLSLGGVVANRSGIVGDTPAACYGVVVSTVGDNTGGKWLKL